MQPVTPTNHPPQAVRRRHQSTLAELLMPLGSSLGILLILIGVFGIVMISSASSPVAIRNHINPAYFGLRQGIYLLIGMLAFLTMQRIPGTLLLRLRWLLLFGTVVLLALVLFPRIGIMVNGARSWLNLGLLRLQPIELTKLALIIFVAGQLRRLLPLGNNLVDIAPLLIITAIVSLLVIAQPDFGGALILYAICGGLLFSAGLNWRWMLLFGAIATLMLTLLTYLSPYRWERMLTAFDPWADPTGNGYQMVNAMIAIGQGGWFGQGLGQSVQKFLYLPEAHTDFLLAITVEELGLVSLLALMLLYALMLARIVYAAACAWRQGNYFGYLCCWGVFWMLATQTLIGLGVNLAVLPTTGIPMPFFSYGGNNLLVCSMALGLVCLSERPVVTRDTDTRDTDTRDKDGRA